jgi:hypothetical protein
VTATSHIGVRSHGLASRVARARSPRSLRRGRASRSPGGGGGSSSGSDQDAAASERYLRVTDGIDLFGREDAIDRDPTPDIRIARDDDDVRPAAALSVVADGLRYADARARRLITLSWSGSSVYMLADGWKILVSVRGVLVHAAVVDDTFGARHLAIHRAGARGVPIDDGVRFVGWIARLITTPTDERAPDLAVNAWGTAGRPPEVKR